MLQDKYQVLRTLIALSHVDGNLCKDERAYIESLINTQPLDQTQKQRLAADFTQPQDPLKLFKQIESPRNRGWLLHIARVLFFKDRKFHDTEKDILAKLQAEHDQTINIAETIMEAEKISHQAGAKFDTNELTFKKYLKDFLKT